MRQLSPTQYAVMEGAARHPEGLAVGTPRTLAKLERMGLVGHVIRNTAQPGTARAYLTTAGRDAIESGI